MSKIFVGGLAISVSNDDLGGHFSRYGTIVDVVAMKQRGFGFVEFAEDFAAQAAVAGGPHVLHGKETSVKVAATREAMADVRGPSHLQDVFKGHGGGNPGSLPNKLFVGGLPKHLTTQLLEEYFSSYGSLSDAVVMGDRGFGFVAFHDREAMERVLDQDHFFDGQPISVKMADGQRPARPAAGGDGGPLPGRGGFSGGGGGFGKAGGSYGGGFGVKKVFVGGIPKDMQTLEMREFFSWYGRLADAVAMEGRGFGFVEFVDQAGADNLMRHAGDIVIRGFKCSLRPADGKGGSGQPKGGGNGGCAWGSPAYGAVRGGGGYEDGSGGRKLFVGGLPGELTDEELRAFFSVYGAISDVKVMSGRGFGFVSFTTSEATSEVLRDQHEMNGKPLTVKLADGKGGPGGKGKGSAPYY